MVTFVGLNNTTRFVRTLTFEFAAMIVMSDCAPLKALPLMLMPPALSDSAVMVPMASTMPFEVATLPVKLIVVGFKRPTSNVPFPAVRVKPPAVTWSSAASSSGLDLAWIYDGRYGVVNDLLMKLGAIDQPIIFLVRPEVTIWAMIGAEIWKTTPFMALLLLAGLQLIPHELYEATALDGASSWQTFWRVTLPLLKPTILVALLFRTIDAVRMFDLPRVLTNGGPGKSTETVVLYTYNTFFTSLNFGYGSTLAVMIFIIVVLVSFIYIKVLGAPTQGARR